MIRINLLSVREAEAEAGRRQEGRLIVLGAALVVAVLGAVEVTSRLRLAPIRAEHQQLQSDLKVLEGKAAELTALEKQRADLDDKLKTIALLEQKKVGPAHILANLSDATPEQVWLLEFTENAGAATISGFAFDNQTIATFMRNLGTSPFFTGVDLVETTQTDQDGASLKKFVVQARLSYSGAPLPPAGADLKFPEPPKGKPAMPQKPAAKGNRA
jgi:type IV pilus assembly protein PilN